MLVQFQVKVFVQMLVSVYRPRRRKRTKGKGKGTMYRYMPMSMFPGTNVKLRPGETRRPASSRGTADLERDSSPPNCFKKRGGTWEGRPIA